jgi:CRISPR/Cas system-associated protein Cas10 (large subunit of type III CRISPR-Cas system)
MKSKGYAVAEFGATGMLEIQRIDAEGIFENDDAAVEQAIKDGIKVIPVEELPKNFNRKYLGWIDTPENRLAIKRYCIALMGMPTTLMIYKSKRGKEIVFDDFAEDDDFGGYWAELCPHCHNKYKGILKGKTDDGGTAGGTCSVRGCENEASYYVDFTKDDVSFVENSAAV